MAIIMAPAVRLAFALALLSPLRDGRAASDDMPSTAAPPGGYSLSYDPTRWTDAYSVFHMKIVDTFGVIGSAFAASDDPRLKPLTRLDSAWSWVVPNLGLPLRIGDGVSSAGLWNQPARLGGIQIGTLAPAPPEVVAPPIWIAAPALNAGPAALANARVIDHLRTLIQVQGQALQTEGRGDFSLEAGRLREDFEVRSNLYGPWITSGNYRYGVTSTTTVDGQLAQVAGQQNYLGVGLVEGLGPLGLVSARVAGSRDLETNGWLARLGYDYQRDRLSLALRSHIQSPGFQEVGDLSLIEAPRQRTLASAGIDLGWRGRISLASATQTYVDYSRRDLIALSHSMPVAGGGIVSTAAAYSPGQVNNAALLLSISYPFDAYAIGARRVDSSVNSALERTIVDAFGQSRLPTAGHPTDR